MARRRFQNPTPKKRGGWWVLRYREDDYQNGTTARRVRREVRLAPVSILEREAKRLAAEKLRPLNQGLVAAGSAFGFAAFVRGTYETTVMPLMAKSTQNRYQGIVDKYLVPAFGELSLRDMTPRTLQAYLASLSGTGLAHESMDKIRDVLSSILRMAVQFEFLLKNPVENLRIPPPKKGKRTKPFMTPEQFQQLIDRVREPYATMVYVAVYTGLRVSELIGLRWVDIHEDSITIDERYCRGDWGPPKSEASNTTIAVRREVIERIHRLRTLTVEVRAGRAVRRYRLVKSDGPEDLVFQSVQAGRPMRDNNILCREIKPAARALGIPWVNWQVLRRSFATWLGMVGASVKDAQALLRHSRASTTLDIYQQFVPESQRRAVDRLGSLGVQ